MYFPRRMLRTCGAVLLLMAAHSHAVVLDWSAVTWTPGALSSSYDIDGLSHNGNDITLAVSGNTNKLTSDPATGTAAPSIATSLQGGTGGDHSLILAGDLSTQTNFTITVTFTGQYGAATGVSFTLFEIDMGADREKIINIYGLLSDGVTKVPGTVTSHGSSVELANPGLSQVLTGIAPADNTGVNSANGNATISFGAHAISSFTFDFKNDGGPPRFQSIALHDIDFTPVPEINPALAAGGVCGLALFVVMRRRARRARA